MALEVVLGSIVDGVSEAKLAVERAIGTCNGTATVETTGFVEHHLLSFAFSNILWRGTRETSLFFGPMTSFLGPISVDLEDIGRPGNHGNASEAFFTVAVRGQNDVSAQPPMAFSPGWNGVEKDGKSVVGNFSR